MKILGDRPAFPVAVLSITVFIAAFWTYNLIGLGGGRVDVFIAWTLPTLLLALGVLFARKQLKKPVWRVVVLVSAVELAMLPVIVSRESMFASELRRRLDYEKLSCCFDPYHPTPFPFTKQRQVRLKKEAEYNWLRSMDDEQLHAFFSFRWSRLSEEEKVEAAPYYRSVMGEKFPKSFESGRHQ